MRRFLPRGTRGDDRSGAAQVSAPCVRVRGRRLTLGCLTGIDASGIRCLCRPRRRGPNAAIRFLKRTASPSIRRRRSCWCAIRPRSWRSRWRAHTSAPPSSGCHGAALPVLEARLQVSAERHLHVGPRHPQPRSVSDSSRRASGRDRRQQDLQVRSGRRRLGRGGRLRLSARDAVIGMRVAREYWTHVAAALLWCHGHRCARASRAATAAQSSVASRGLGRNCDWRGHLPRRLHHLPRPGRTGCAACDGRLRHPAAGLHGLRVRDGGSGCRLDRRRARGRPDSRAVAPHAGIRRRADDGTDRRRRWPRSPVLFGSRVAARRSELPSRHLHRKGVPRERSGLDEHDHSRRGTGRRQRAGLRAALRFPQPDRSGDSDRRGEIRTMDGRPGSATSRWRFDARSMPTSGADRLRQRAARSPSRRATRIAASATATTSSNRSPCLARRCHGTRSFRCTADSRFHRTATRARARRICGRRWDSRTWPIAASDDPGHRKSSCCGHGRSASASEWDVVPQLQVSLSKIQHVVVAAGVRVPVNCARRTRPFRRDLSVVGLVRRAVHSVLEVADSRCLELLHRRC